MKSELKARNKITAIGTLAVPVLRYSFGIINWRIKEIKQIDRKTKKTLTTYKIHHPKAAIDRLYVKRKEGGRGLVQVEAANKAEIPYFPAHRTHRNFLLGILEKNNDECILILVIYWKKTGLLHTKISNRNIIYSL